VLQVLVEEIDRLNSLFELAQIHLCDLREVGNAAQANEPDIPGDAQRSARAAAAGRLGDPIKWLGVR